MFDLLARRDYADERVSSFRSAARVLDQKCLTQKRDWVGNLMAARIYALDYLKMVLVAFVVIGHSGLGAETLGLPYIIFANTLFRAAVPLFAIVSGFLLFGTMRRGKQLTWIKRLLLLYVVWFAIYFVVMHLWDRGVRQNLYDLAFGFHHLWFLLALAVGALMLGYLQRFGARTLAISGAVLAAIGLVMQFVSVTHLLNIPLPIYRSGPFFIYPFLVMGFLFAIARYHPEEFPWQIPERDVLIKLVIAGSVIALIENAVALTMINRFALLEFPAGIFLMAPAIFGLAMRMDAPPTSLPLGQMALAIYVMHVLFLYGASQVGWTHPLLPALAGYIVPALMVLAMRRYASANGWLVRMF